MGSTISLNQEQNRILSIDFFRGFTMFILVCGIEGLFREMDPAQRGPIISFIVKQTSHARWGTGIHCWDLIQPFFMFIVGVAMPFSFSRRWERGDSWEKTFHHVLRRCLFLLLLGWAHQSSATVSNFNDVLAQLSVTYLVAFLLMRYPIKWQLIASFALLLVSYLLYRFWPVEGFNQPFIADHNFGSWTDTVLNGSTKEKGYYAPFNAIPSSAHTIWGVVVGMVLMKEWSHRKKILTFLIVGIIGILIGYTMNSFIPIIKQICTSSFIIVTGGYCLIAMAISYWVIDVLKFRKVPLFFAVFGMNSIFIYLMAGSFRNFFGRMINPYMTRLFGWTNESTLIIIQFIIIAAMLWGVCYFMYKRKIFIRL